MLYFAYGSNMDPSQIRARCPSARFIAVAEFPEHRLAFTRYARDRACGTCDALPENGTSIWGVIFDISASDLSCLDQHEGYQPDRPVNKNAYWREQRAVFRNGNANDPVCVWLYFANRQPDSPAPSPSYMRQLIEGAKHWRLPNHYIEQLARVTTS